VSDGVRFDLVVGAGILLQCTLLVLPDLRTLRGLRNYAFAFAVGLLGFVPGKHETDYDVPVHLLAYFFVVAMATFWLFRQRLMPRVSESSAFVRSLVFWYLLLSVQSGQIPPAIWVAASVPTVVTLAVAFSVRSWSFRTKLFMYVWFLVETVAIALLFLQLSDLSYLSRAAGYHTTATPLDLFVTGMALTYLAGSAAYIYQLWPPLKKQDRWQYGEWREHTDFALSRFVDYQMRPKDVATITAVVVALFVLNALTRLMPASTLGAIVVVVVPHLVGQMFDRSSVPEGALLAPAIPEARRRRSPRAPAEAPRA
jgi:hypothetical protein